MSNNGRRIQRIRDPKISEPPEGMFSNCLVVDGIAYISGITPRGAKFEVIDGDMYAQSQAVFRKIKQIVEAAGGTMRDIVKLTVFVTDISTREGFWKARREFFTGDFPTATLVQVGALADPSFRVEVEAIAHIGAGGS
ncbi:MAG TPA: RidA family protein [Xanthobacteraceae bacterium]|jgi:enamine deaminase RidA (YjgF/YER057c/UK114 family)|nr:RidA family protein [Xanthobacteraceae bacterium]